MPIEFTTLDGGRGLELFDPIMRHRTTLRFPSPVDPKPADGGTLTFPVERAVAVETPSVSGEVVTAAVFDERGERIENIRGEQVEQTLDPGTYQFSLSEGMKLYLHAEAPEGVKIVRPDVDQGRLEFGTNTRLTIGARSHHERPAGVVTTTEDPTDVMAAVSTFGSALKDTSPMRSFPSLRGHPPAVELGDSLDVPEGIEPPETGIRLELPAERHLAYAAAPVAYYLGAEVVPGETPRVVTDSGLEYPLDGWATTTALDYMFREVFVLDTLVREDDPFCGPHPGRETFETETGIDLDGLFDRSPARRLHEYLEMPAKARERFRPNWYLGARVASAPASVEHLSALAYRLATIHPSGGTEVASSVAELGAPDGRRGRMSMGGSGSIPAGMPLPPGADVEPGSVVAPGDLDVARQIWVGPGTPMGAAKHDVDAARRGRDRSPIDGNIRYVVVCNDDRMAEENQTVRDLLTDQAGLSFDADSHRNLTADELREALAADVEFFHFVGHADERGFECVDGHLDPATVETVGTDVFFLNSCLSYDAGSRLVEAGALAGVVTLGEVQNSVATEMGRHVATLVNGGIRVGAAVSVAADACEAERYTVIGDDDFGVVNSNNPGVDAVASADEESLVHTYHPASIHAPNLATRWVETGVEPDVDVGGGLFLDPDVDHRCPHDTDDYFDHISGDNAPIWIDGDLYRLDQITAEDLYTR